MTAADHIGPYELAEELGSGGMGTVFRAVDTRTGQAVALKVMDSRLAKDPDYVRRFQREAEIAKKLDSPHIVRVLDSGQDGNQHYLAMEYVEGKNLTEVLRERGKLPPDEARSVATQVALALEAGHEQGVVHRDIKPGNILIAPDGRAKVTDFGIARAADSTTITKTGLFLGTLSYAAPELLAGKADIRSDIYSLGVVLYQMLAGRVPFEADTPLALMDMHRGQEPPTLESLGVRVPGDLRAIVARCLVKRPEERYQNPEQLAAALEGRALAATAATASGATGQVPPSGPSGSVLAEWFKRGGSRYALLGVGIAGVALAAVIIAVAAANGGRGESGEEVVAATSRPAATSTPRPKPTSTPRPRPTSTPVQNRMNCDAIRGTNYRSAEERDWFLRTCLGQTSGSATLVTPAQPTRPVPTPTPKRASLPSPQAPTPYVPPTRTPVPLPTPLPPTRTPVPLPTPLPPTVPPSPTTHVVQIVYNIAVPWQDTGIDLTAGQALQVTASGSATYDFGHGDHYVGPDGREEGVPPVLGGWGNCQIHSLVGWIGSYRPGPATWPLENILCLGASFGGVAPASGRLYLAMNDYNGDPTVFTDNRGTWSVTALYNP